MNNGVFEQFDLNFEVMDAFESHSANVEWMGRESTFIYGQARWWRWQLRWRRWRRSTRPASRLNHITSVTRCNGQQMWCLFVQSQYQSQRSNRHMYLLLCYHQYLLTLMYQNSFKINRSTVDIASVASQITKKITLKKIKLLLSEIEIVQCSVSSLKSGTNLVHHQRSLVMCLVVQIERWLSRCTTKLNWSKLSHKSIENLNPIWQV